VKTLYLSFLNTCGLPAHLVDVIAVEPHTGVSMAGWHGIVSLICRSTQGDSYDIDVRYAGGNEIFRQYLVDHGWTERLLLTKKHKNEPIHHKVIVYLCQPETGLKCKSSIQAVPPHSLVGNYWSTIHHIYLLLPINHPFDISNLDQQSYQFKGFSTTRSLSKENTEVTQFLPSHQQHKVEGGLRLRGVKKLSNKDTPLVSIITVVFNGEKYLEQTIQSVINQTYSNTEYIIVDGGSTDGTLDIIKKYEDYIDCWASETDRGISHAFNKGIQVATGQWIGLIHCGDLFFPDTLQHIFESEDLQGYQFIFGDMIWQDNSQITFRPGRPDYADVINYTMPLNHPTIFVSRETYEQHGMFSEKYKYAMDYELMLRIHKRGGRGKYIQYNISCMRGGGEHQKRYLQTLNEARKISKEHGGNSIIALLVLVYTFVNQKIISFPIFALLRLFKKRFVLQIRKEPLL